MYTLISLYKLCLKQFSSNGLDLYIHFLKLFPIKLRSGDLPAPLRRSKQTALPIPPSDSLPFPQNTKSTLFSASTANTMPKIHTIHDAEQQPAMPLETSAFSGPGHTLADSTNELTAHLSEMASSCPLLSSTISPNSHFHQ